MSDADATDLLVIIAALTIGILAACLAAIWLG